jgi:hypothetical protein
MPDGEPAGRAASVVGVPGPGSWRWAADRWLVAWVLQVPVSGWSCGQEAAWGARCRLWECRGRAAVGRRWSGDWWVVASAAGGVGPWGARVFGRSCGQEAWRALSVVGVPGPGSPPMPTQRPTRSADHRPPTGVGPRVSVSGTSCRQEAGVPGAGVPLPGSAAWRWSAGSGACPAPACVAPPRLRHVMRRLGVSRALEG